MLDYIKSQIQQKLHENDAYMEQMQESQMNEAILECAHLVQELDDLSMDGTEVNSTRPFTKIDIPIEDDIEITAVELNALDGRVLSAPMDATVQESDADYTRMKTMDDFYQEAMMTGIKFERESYEQFAHRMMQKANQNYVAYKNRCIQEGAFGFDKISVNDSRVPARVTLDFGKMNGKDYTVKLIVKFEVDKKNQIMKKQLDSLAAFQSQVTRDGFIQGAAFAAFGNKVGIDNLDDIWSKVTPVELVIPAKPTDKFCVAVGFELDGTGEDFQYIEWHASIKGQTETGFAKKTETTTPSVGEIKKLNTITKGDAIRQEAALIASGYHAPSRFFQEEIDFGNPDAAPDANNADAPAVSFDAPPPADGMDQPAAPEGGEAAPVDGGDAATDAPVDAAAPEEPKETVDTNNVSDQIAEKVSDETQADANADTDVNIDGVDATSDVDATPTDEEISAELGEEPAGDDASTTEPAETSDIDFDNMTIDELMAQGQEKMKTMTMQQLKDFLQGGELPNGDTIAEEPPAAGEGVQEAFFLTRGNIGKELDIHLRKSLGILNNNEMEIEQICSEFKREGKKLNRVVHKASTMKKVFDETECKQLLRLNHCLTDLMTMLRADIDKGSVMTVKRMIQAFVSDATGVLKMIEQKNDPGKPVQEQTVFGVGPVSDSREYDIPIKCPDKMSHDQVLIIQALFSSAVGSGAKDSILRKIVYPYCFDNGLRQNALNKLYEYMTGEKTDNADEAELQENFEHYEYYLEFLYPPAAGEIVSDTKAYITFDSDCSYIKNLKDTKRPTGYVQLKVEVSIDGGKFSAKLVSPQQSKSFDILALDMNDLGEWYDTSKNRSQFVTVQEG